MLKPLGSLKNGLVNNLKKYEAFLSFSFGVRGDGFCLGFFCPNIYISTGLLKLMNEKEIESIILHEKFHLLSRDTLYIAIFSFAKYLFFLFPVIGDIVKNSLLQREIKADKFAIFILDETKYIKSAFRKLLLRDAYVPLFVSSTPFYTQSFIEERIKILAGEKTSAIRVNKRNILFTFTSLVFILIASFYPIKVVDAHASTEKPHVCSVNHACQQTCSNPE